MTDVNDTFVAELVAAGVERREARWLVEEFVPGGDVDAAIALRQAAARRLGGEPLQYIIGHWPFRTLDLDVDDRVLIPRPETEELVDIALKELAVSGAAAPIIVDLGTGSGAIGLSLLAELAQRGVAASLVALDESPDALDVARRNAAKHRLFAASFVRSSWFSSLDESLRGRVDLVVANPPYVGEEEFETLDPVLRYEPYGALVAGDARGVAGFSDLEIIISEAPAWLRENGVLVCEHANIHGTVASELARSVGFREVDDLADLAGQSRVLVARR
ncbi:MAG TPA: peptide chain release factor N(5)-glutamine methyltransferase [Acidimicrobiales bacterium]|nr:peptide chain release factor N(5)-glutamine methyltransferase [Acidimicrobiales bacterium]